MASPRPGLDGDGLAAGALLLAGLVAEIRATASDTQRNALLRATGARIAALAPMTGVDDLTTLTGRVNDFWSRHHCGSARFTLEDDGILITHTGLPTALGLLVGGRMEIVLRPVLEGIYGGWMRQMGAGPTLRTRTTRWNDAEIRLKHGR